jgi:uncharacterized protein YraI
MMQDPPIEPDVREARIARTRARRRRRRALGTLVFLVLAVVVIVAAVLTFTGSVTTVRARPPPRLQRAGSSPRRLRLTACGPSRSPTASARSGPGTTYPSVGTLQTGTKVMVEC